MNGYGSHTFMWVNAAGEACWVKYHFKTDQGIAQPHRRGRGAIAARGPRPTDARPVRAIEARRGARPGRLYVQIMPFADAADYRFNPFDLTKVWPHPDYPLVTIGRLVLDRNPENYFAEIEQAAFEPGEHGARASARRPDKMLLGRLFSYPDTHRHRIGANYLQLPINAPRSRSTATTGTARCATATPATRCTRRTLRRPDGRSVAGEPDVAGRGGEIVRSAYTLHAEDDDFGQPAPSGPTCSPKRRALPPGEQRRCGCAGRSCPRPPASARRPSAAAPGIGTRPSAWASSPPTVSTSSSSAARRRTARRGPRPAAGR